MMAKGEMMMILAKLSPSHAKDCYVYYIRRDTVTNDYHNAAEDRADTSGEQQERRIIIIIIIP